LVGTNLSPIRRPGPGTERRSDGSFPIMERGSTLLEQSGQCNMYVPGFWRAGNRKYVKLPPDRAPPRSDLVARRRTAGWTRAGRGKRKPFASGLRVGESRSGFRTRGGGGGGGRWRGPRFVSLMKMSVCPCLKSRDPATGWVGAAALFLFSWAMRVERRTRWLVPPGRAGDGNEPKAEKIF